MFLKKIRPKYICKVNFVDLGSFSSNRSLFYIPRSRYLNGEQQHLYKPVNSSFYAVWNLLWKILLAKQ